MPPYVSFIVLACVAAFWSVTGIVKNRKDAPLRAEALAQPVQWSDSVRVQVWDRAFGLPWGSSTGPVRLNVRGGYIELTGTFPASAAMGFRWYFRSFDIRVQMVRRIGALPLMRERVLLTGRSSGHDVRVLIWTWRNSRAIWDALVAAGASPDGPPPGGYT